MSIDVGRFLPQYFEESESCLCEIELCLPGLASEAWDVALADRAARAAHCIKGNSGAFGFEEISALAAEIEYVLRRAGLGFGQANAALREDLEFATLVLKALLRSRHGGVCGDLEGMQEAVSRLADWQAMHQFVAQRVCNDEQAPEQRTTRSVE